jgi:hypothetical protein
MKVTISTFMLLIGLSIVLSGCGAVQTKAHDPVGAGGLQPTQDDKDAGLAGISAGFQLKEYRVIAVDRLAVDRLAVDPEDIKDEDDKALAASMPTFLQSELVGRLRASGLFDKGLNLSETQVPPNPERVLKLEGTITWLTGGSAACQACMSRAGGVSSL